MTDEMIARMKALARDECEKAEAVWQRGHVPGHCDAYEKRPKVSEERKRQHSRTRERLVRNLLADAWTPAEIDEMMGWTTNTAMTFARRAGYRPGQFNMTKGKV